MPRPKLPRDENGNIIRVDAAETPVVVSDFEVTVTQKTDDVESLVVTETPKVTAVSVWRGPTFIREYSLKNHGEGFKELAEEFVRGNRGCEVR